MHIFTSKLLRCVNISHNLLKARNTPASETLTSIVTSFRKCSTNYPAASSLNIEAITHGDENLNHKLKVLILEVDVLRQEGKPVPENEEIKEHQWKEMLALRSISARRKYLEYLFKISKKKENFKFKKEKKRLERESEPLETRNRDLPLEEWVHKYDLAHNTLFLRFYESTMNHMYNNRLVKAMQFDQKIVIDCGYDAKMTNRESRSCAKQLMLLFADNRNHNQPFDLHFCNSNPSGVLMEALHRYIPIMYDASFPMNLHENSYLEHFPAEKLVYLTPHTREEMTEFDHDAIYIIGGIVDKVNQEPLSLAKAKKEGLKMKKLPLDRYLDWSAGSGKSLTLNQMISILLDVRETGDWKYSLRHVPSRKLVQNSANSEERNSGWRPRNKGILNGWRPSKNNDSNSFENSSKKYNKQNERILKVRSIMFD